MDPIAQAQDDLRREQMMAAAKRFLPWAALALVVLLAAVGVREIMHAVKEGQNKSQTEQLVAAQSASDSVPALLDVTKRLHGDHAAFATLIAFQRMDVETQKTQGIVTLDALAADAKAPKVWRDFAALTATKARVAFGATAKDAEALLTTLTPVLNDNTSPWQNAARIQAALIQGVMQKDADAALKTLEPIDLTKIDPKLAGQVNDMRLQFGVQTKDKP